MDTERYIIEFGVTGLIDGYVVRSWETGTKRTFLVSLSLKCLSGAMPSRQLDL